MPCTRRVHVADRISLVFTPWGVISAATDDTVLRLEFVRCCNRPTGMRAGALPTSVMSFAGASWPGVRRLCLAVAENNSAALAFWRRAGFRDTGLREHPADYTTPLAVLDRPLT